MCLLTNRTKPLVASKDLVVSKVLIIKDGKYYTPHQMTEVELNSYLTASASISENTKCFGYHQIRTEGVHSYTHLVKRIGFKAIIPKGTQFWISSDLTEIASTELYITNKMYDEETDLKEICDLLLKENFIKYEENKIILLDKYHISINHIGERCSYNLLDNFNIQLFDKNDLSKILSYILYINALLYRYNFKLLSINDWYWSKDKYSDLCTFIVDPSDGYVSNNGRSLTYYVLAVSEF